MTTEITQDQQTIAAQREALAKADAKLKELGRLKQENTKLRNASGKDQGKIASLTENAGKLRGDVERHKAIAENANEQSNKLRLRMTELEQDQGAVCGGSYIARTTKARKVAGSVVDAGELLGYITPCKGVTPLELIHSLYYRTANATESEKHDVFSKAVDAAGQLEGLEKQIEEMRAESLAKDRLIEMAKGELDEAARREAELAEANARLLEDVTSPENDDDGEGEGGK